MRPLDAAADPASGIAPPPSPDASGEASRLAALQRLGVLDTGAEPLFDSLTEAAARVCGTPIALVSLIDAQRQWFKSNLGLPGVTETPREVAFCDHAIRDGRVLEVGDAATDARFAANPLVTGDPNIRFYAGAPIELPGGERIGTVCVIDRAPRRLDAAQRATLQSLASIAGHALAERVRLVSANRAQAASEARYRAIVEDQTELISVAEPDGTLTFVNTAFARQHGRLADDFIGRSLLELVHADDRLAVQAHLAQVVAASGTVVGLNRIVTANGPPRWIAWSNRCLRDAAGHPVAIQSVGRDITEQRLAEQALADSEARHRRQYEASPAILHSIDTQGRLVAVSDRWLALLGFSREQVIGRPSTDFMTPESQRHARQNVLPDFFRTGRVEGAEYRMVRSDGEPVDVRLSAILERDADGAPLHSMAILEDVTARNRIAAELGRTHAHLDAIVDNVPAMLGYWDAAGITRFANREFQAAVGLPIDRLIGSPLAEVCHAVDPTGYATLAPHVAGVLQGRRAEFEFSMLTTSGLRQLRAALVPDRSVPGRINGFHGLWVDITGQKALELRLSQSELRYRSLFDHLNSGFALHQVIVDDAGRPVDYKFLAMNPAFAAMTGLDPAHAIGRRVCELLPGTATDPADWIGVFGRVALGGEPVHFEQRSAELDRWYDVIAYRPAPGQFAVIAQDVTQRRATAAALALGEQRLQLLVDAVQDHAMIQLDSEGRIRTWNVGARRIFGFGAAEIVGEHCGRLFATEDDAKGDPERQLAEAAERGRLDTEGWRRRKDGSRFWASATLTPLRHPKDGLLGFVAELQDLTERRREQTLAQQVAELAPVATLQVDAADRIAFVNGRAEALFRCARGHLIGEAFDRLLPERHWRVDPQTPELATVRALRPDGTAFEAELRVARFETADGSARIVAVREVGERLGEPRRIEPVGKRG